ncbi:MAG: type II secretion system F family protein [Myxococcota bacterium]|nr:type II secretion system F family protein [Myxococcota bacterium]
MYAYKGVAHNGKKTHGAVSADNARAARARMRTQGIYLTELAEAPDSARTESSSEASRLSMVLSRLALRRIPPMERAVATRQLSTLLTAGIPLVESLGALVDQIEHARLRTTFAQIRDRVNEGASLADALASTRQFDDLYLSMIRAGEASGALGSVLGRIADYLEDQLRLSNKVLSIMLYPAVMLLFSLAVVGVLVTVVLPQITTLMISMDQALPLITRMIIGASDFVRGWWWALAIGAIGAGLGLRAFKRTERGRVLYDRLRLRLPVIGGLVRVLAIARLTRTLSTLLASGVGIVKSLDIARLVANNTVIAEAVDHARTAIIEGAPLAAPLRASGQFPSMVTTMIEVGEQSGELESMLAKVADTYDEQVENTITRMTALIEPALILVMVGVVLVIILATLQPLLALTSSLN